MKKLINKRFYFFAAMILILFSCEDYLDKTPDSEISDQSVFGTYESFQGFQDVMYGTLVDMNNHSVTCGAENGDHTIAFQAWSSARKFADGRYWSHLNTVQSNYWTTRAESAAHIADIESGVWIDSWKGIRIANYSLDKLYLLVASDEQMNLIKGQALFLRAYFHWEIALRWGGIPYIDKVLMPDDDMRIPRLNFQETVERIVEDLDLAATLLPEDWDLTETGKRSVGTNTGRATRGAALATKAKALLFAGSPLMVADAGGSYEYDMAYMERAAEAAWEVIEMANRRVYELIHFDNIQLNFARKDGTVAWTKEWIWGKTNTSMLNGPAQMERRHGRIYSPGRFGGNDITETPVQNLVDMFEMKNGLPIDDPASGYNEMDPWSNRDPRFRAFIYVDGDMAGYSPLTRLALHEGGIDKSNEGIMTSYLVKKFWPLGVNTYDREWTNYYYATPHIRLADIYLVYAEAVNEVWGPNGKSSNATMTALEAVNAVRNRPGLEMPPVNQAFTHNKEAFRERIWNERSVELCFEGARWNDIRRWYVAHLPEYKVQYDLEFDRNHTVFNRVVRFNRVFDQRHYWFPFPRQQTQIYYEWPQNPGW